MLNGDEIMSKIHLEQRGFVYSVLIGFKTVGKESNLEKIEKKIETMVIVREYWTRNILARFH